LIFSALLLVLGIFQYIISKYNFSILLIAGYMLYSKKATDRRDINDIRNLLFKRSRFLKKGVYPGRELVVLESTRLGS